MNPDIEKQHHHTTQPVAQPQVYEVHVVESRLRHQNHDKIPVVPRLTAILLLVVNIFFPGWGTFALAFFTENHVCYFILIGLLQFILFPILIGWIWAIITSCQVLSKSAEYNE